jgi:hypothetical protein
VALCGWFYFTDGVDYSFISQTHVLYLYLSVIRLGLPYREPDELKMAPL